MKKTVALLIAYLISHTGFAQNPLSNIAFQEITDASLVLMTVLNGNYYFADNTTSSIYSVSKAGQLRFKIPFNTPVSYTDMKPMYNGIAFACNGDNPCYEGQDSIYILKIDSLGNLIFKSSMLVNNGSAKLLVYSDSSLYAFANDTLYHLNKNGLVFRKQNLGLGTIASVCMLKNGHFLFSNTTTGNGTIQLTETDTSAAVIKQQTISYTFSKLSAPFGLSSSGFMASVDTSLQITATTQTAQGSIVISDFSFLQDTIYACGNDGNQHLVYFKFDSLLQKQYQFTSVFPRVLPVQISASKQQIAFLATENANIYHPNTYLSLTSINGNNAFSYPADAGITQVALDSNYVDFFVPSGAPATVHEMDLNYKLKVTVKNFGTDTLHTVYINHMPNIPPGYSCGNYYYTKYVSGLQLAPNDSITILTDLIHALGEYLYKPIPQDTTWTFPDFCAWTSAPNNKSDNNHNNDLSCSTVAFHTTGIKEFGVINDELSVWPNPASNHLTLTLSEGKEIVSVSVYDVLGTEVSVSHVELVETAAQATAQIDISSLNEGIYFVQVNTAAGILIKKVIVQR